MKNFNLLIALFALVALSSCVEDDDFAVPTTSPGENVEITGTFVTLDALYSRMVQDDYLSRIPADSDLYTSGYVVTSDEAGNFFEELYIQDAPENPTRGARIAIDVNPLSARYVPGQKIYLRLSNLTLTSNTEPEFNNFGDVQNGDFLGLNIGQGTTLGRVEQISAFQESDRIVRDNVRVNLVPTPVGIEDLGVENMYTAILLEDVQFDRRQIDLTFAGEASDRFDGDRTLVSCSSNSSALFQTSTFADYKSISLPDGRGTMRAVLSTDFFGENYALTVNTPEDIDLTDMNRCDPDFLECDTPANGGSNVLFDQDFETLTDESQLDGMGYININTSGGGERYERGNFSNNTYLSVNAFGQSDDPMVAWLVLPSLDMDATTEEILEFAIQANFDSGGLLEVFISNNFTGDVDTTDWSQIDAAIPQGPSGGFASGFTAVPALNISCIDGTDVRIAFKYTGSDPQGTTTRYHIDDIKVSGI